MLSIPNARLNFADGLGSAGAPTCRSMLCVVGRCDVSGFWTAWPL